MSSQSGAVLLRKHGIASAQLRSMQAPRADSEASLDAARAQLFMRANDPILLIDLDGNYLDVNDAACRQLGYTRAELLGMNALQINGITPAAWSRTALETMRLGSRVLDTTYRSREGLLVAMEVSVSVVNYEGSPAFLSIARNIERRKRAESELARRSLDLATLAPDAIRDARSSATSSRAVQGSDTLSLVAAILPAFVAQAKSQVCFDSLAIALYVLETGQFIARLFHQDGIHAQLAAVRPCSPALFEILQQAQPVLFSGGDVLHNLGESPSANGRAGTRQGILLPLLAGGRLVGALGLGRNEAPGFQLADADVLMAWAGSIGAAIDEAYLLEGIRALAILEERSRLSRELHDRLGQAVAAAGTYSDIAAQMLEKGYVGKANWAVGEVAKALQEAQYDLRDAIQALRSVDTAPELWVDNLQHHMNRYEQQWGIHCKLEVGAGAVAACGPRGRVGLMCILQEALTNVRKHSQSKRVWVSVEVEGASVLACVADEGQGFDTAASMQGHYGLETMRERAESLGGKLSISSGPSGTRVSVRVPACYTP